MSRRLTGGAAGARAGLVAGLVALAAPAAAQAAPAAAQVAPAAAQVAPAAALVAPAAALVAPAVAARGAASDDVGPAGQQALGGALGLAIGGRTTPGGLELGGGYLYRLSERDWLETSASFTFGGGAAGCFRDREDAVLCDHGGFDGFAGEAAASLRRYLGGQGGIDPFARLGVGLRLVSYGGDDLRGLAVPFLVGGGVRARVGGGVDLVTAAVLRVGIGQFGRGVASEPHLSLALLGGVEFALD